MRRCWTTTTTTPPPLLFLVAILVLALALSLSTLTIRSSIAAVAAAASFTAPLSSLLRLNTSFGWAVHDRAGLGGKRDFHDESTPRLSLGSSSSSNSKATERVTATTTTTVSESSFQTSTSVAGRGVLDSPLYKDSQGSAQSLGSSATAAAVGIGSIMASTCPVPESAGAGGEESVAKTTESKAGAEDELPKLSAADFRAYNRLAVMMDAYHNHFRYTWNLLYKTCSTGSRPAGMSLRAFITHGLRLCQSLTIHHTIEENHVFPELGERMPAFRPHDHLISQHEKIHEGLEKMEQYLDSCTSGEKELRLPELKDIMDTFGEVLWAHLDDEVRMLGAENMRKYWTKEEIGAMYW